MNRISRIILGFFVTVTFLMVTLSANAVDKDGNFVLVIDPGHGGKDPGAVRILERSTARIRRKP